MKNPYGLRLFYVALLVAITLICAILLVVALCALSGCADIDIKKSDGTRYIVRLKGESKVKQVRFYKDPNGITYFSIDTASNTPKGIAELIKEIGEATEGVLTGGLNDLIVPDQ